MITTLKKHFRPAFLISTAVLTIGSFFILTALPIKVSAGDVDPSTSLVTTSAGTITADGGSVTVDIILKDSDSNPVSAVPASSIVISTGPADTTITQPVLDTDVNGHTSGLIHGSVAGNKKVIVTVGSVVINAQPELIISPGAATVGNIVAVPNATVEASLTGSTAHLNITVRDAHGNTVNGNIPLTLNSTPLTTIDNSNNAFSGLATRAVTFSGKGDVTLNFSGLSASGDTVLHFVDTTVPDLTHHDDVLNVEATSPAGAAVTFTLPTATDNIDGALTVTCNPASGATFPLGAFRVTCSATDSSGNIGTTQFNVVVVDTTAPVITAPAPVTAEATAVHTVVNLGTATAVDTVDAHPVITNDAPSAGFTVGTHTVTWTATDASGNHSSATQTVTITDTTKPIITAPADQTFEATGPLTSPTLVQATAVDLGDANPVITYSPHDFSVGTHEVTWVATDASGNTSQTTSSVTITDKTGPVIASHADVTVEATSHAGALVNYDLPVANDLVDLTADTVSCTPLSATVFPLGETTITCTASDLHGNAATPTTFKVKVVDTTAPTLSHHDDVTVEATSHDSTIVTFASPTATDLVDGTDAVSCVPPSGSAFPFGAYRVTCSATDSAGNTGSTQFNVIVVDTTAPTITAPADITQTANGVLSTVILGIPTASDLVDGSPTVTNDAPTVGFPVGTTDVTWTVTDASGNHASAVQHVTITPAPVSQISISADPDHTTVDHASTITVSGKDQFGHPVTNDSSTVVVLSTDNGGALDQTLLTFTHGTASTKLHKTNPGVVHVNASSGIIVPVSTTVTFDESSSIVLAINNVSLTKSFATADNNFDDGWQWVIRVTAPTAENQLAMKFGDFVGTNSNIGAANNVRIYSPQSSDASASTSAITITGADHYSSYMNLNGDADPNTPGRQVDLIVETRVPEGTGGGSYSTSFGVKTHNNSPEANNSI